MRRPDWQLSRNGLFWVLFAFIAVVALHLDHLPAWVTFLTHMSLLSSLSPEGSQATQRRGW